MLCLGTRIQYVLAMLIHLCIKWLLYSASQLTLTLMHSFKQIKPQNNLKFQSAFRICWSSFLLESFQRDHIQDFLFFKIIMGLFQIEHITTQMFNDLVMGLTGISLRDCFLLCRYGKQCEIRTELLRCGLEAKVLVL